MHNVKIFFLQNAPCIETISQNPEFFEIYCKILTVLPWRFQETRKLIRNEEIMHIVEATKRHQNMSMYYQIWHFSKL